MKFFGISAAAVIFSTFLPVHIYAATAIKEFEFDVQNRRIKINKELDRVDEAFADIIVLPDDFQRDLLTAENAPLNKMIYKMAYTSGGNVNESIAVSKDFSSGEYNLYIECGEFSDRIRFIVPSDKLGDAVNKINSQGVVASADFGADTVIFNENKTLINTFMKNIASNSALSESSFIEAYMQSSAAAQLINSKISLGDMQDLYGIYFDDVFLKSENMSDTELENYMNAVKNYDIGKATPTEVFSGAVFVSECKMAKEQYALLEKVTSYIKENALSYGKYESLSSYHKNIVGGNLKNALSGLHSADSIYNKFIGLSKTQYEAMDNNGGGGSSSGGGGSSSSGGGNYVMGSSAQEAQKPIVEQKSSFSDIKGHWAEEYIAFCSKKGMIKGYDDNTYRPQANITRAETAALLVRLFGLKEISSQIFTDVPSGSWYGAFVAAAYENDIIQGDNGMYRPDEKISRQDIAVMLNRALTKRGISLSGTAVFGDSSYISDYAKESVGVLASNGVINGSDGKFRPLDNLTRAEAAALIYRVNNIYTGGESR